ncbi:dihydrofolate reductase family protein [Streptomyces sp. NPDC053755]|uniref:dihydrofolate reductase family protein n=1 Tax=Streptomyces sp. NPDC053755 TaxID=3155815 RepID=UPI003445E4AA
MSGRSCAPATGSRSPPPGSATRSSPARSGEVPCDPPGRSRALPLTGGGEPADLPRADRPRPPGRTRAAANARRGLPRRSARRRQEPRDRDGRNRAQSVRPGPRPARDHSGDLAEHPGRAGDIVVYAGGRLVRTRVEHDLVDEFRLVVLPVVLGAGERLFGALGDTKPPWSTCVPSATASPLTYRPVRDVA